MGMAGAGQQPPPPYPGQCQLGQAALQQPSTPIFVAPPPKTQRLLHSEAYLKYIEGLHAETPSINKWDQTLSGVCPCNIPYLMFICAIKFLNNIVVTVLGKIKSFHRLALTFIEIYNKGTVKSGIVHIEWTLDFFLHCAFVFVPIAYTARRKDVHLTKEQESRLPLHWLKSKGAHTTMADALWRLRDLMLRDTLNIRQAYNLWTTGTTFPEFLNPLLWTWCTSEKIGHEYLSFLMIFILPSFYKRTWNPS